MAVNINDLKEVLKETLEERGVLTKIKARIRAEIFNSLNEQAQDKATLTNDNLVINELIREYLEYNNYNHALSVFIPESGQPLIPPFKREQLTKKLKLVEDQNTKELPLLYGLVFGVKKLVSNEKENEEDLEEKRMVNDLKKQNNSLYQDEKSEISKQTGPRNIAKDIFSNN